MKWFFALWLVVCLGEGAEAAIIGDPGAKLSCPQLLATALGSAGPMTITYDEEGNLTYWYDGYFRNDDGLVPHFTRTTHRLHLGNLGRLQSISAQTSPERTDGYLVATDARGILKIVTPEHKIYSVNVPGTAQMTAATLFRPDTGHRQQAVIGDGGLRMVEDPQLDGRALRGRVRAVQRETEYELYVAVGRTLYRSVMKPRELSAVSESLRQALLTGSMVRVRQVPPRLPNEVWREEVEAASLSLIDFDPGQTNLSLWLPTIDATLAMEIRPFERVLTMREEVMDTINYVQVVSSRRVVVASELGKVAVVDPAEKRSVHKPTFPGGVWLKAISAHRVGDQVQIWAINAVGNGIWRWTSTDLENTFTLFDPQLPAGVTPVSIATAAQTVPVNASIPMDRSREGYLTSVIVLPQNAGVVHERVLVMGSDGNLYAYTIPRGRNLMEETNPARAWVMIPFPPASR